MDLINTHLPLEKEESNYRKTLISDIKYILFLNFTKINLTYYEGFVKIQFNMKEASNIHLDYGGIIKNITVNDATVVAERKLNRLYLSREHLRNGINKIEIKFNSLIKANTKREFKIFSNADKVKFLIV